MSNTNVGTADRAIRVIVGLGVLSLFFLYPEASWRYAALLGFITFLTGALGTSPLYSALGMSTCPMRRA